MQTKIIHIRNMCCQRCIDAVKTELLGLGLKVNRVNLGVASYIPKSRITSKIISQALYKRGFEIIASEEDRLVEEIKIALITLSLHSPEESPKSKTNLHGFLEVKTGKPYRKIYKLFLVHTGLTIEKFAILLRIEKVKELIELNKLNFSEIADATGYKSQQHLSGQFKKVTGINMLEYRNNKGKRRSGIDKL